MIPTGFVFSQSSLQDYVDCARRFQLRHLDGCRWPAPETADALELEAHLRRGQSLHRLMRQVYSGISLDALSALAATDSNLERWWSNYLTMPPTNLPDELREPEVALSTPLGRYRLEARYDLLAGRLGERWVIVDWKTARRRSTRSWLAQRLQTRLYPFVLVKAGATLNGGRPIAAEQVEMVYWFSEFPAQVEHFHYSLDLLAADAAFLDGLLAEIETRADGVFPKTEDRRVCRFCVYRSLCWDDVHAGRLAEVDELEASPPDLEEIDLDSIVPIPF